MSISRNLDFKWLLYNSLVYGHVNNQNLLISSSLSLISLPGVFVGGAPTFMLGCSLGEGGFIGPFVFVEKVS